MFVGGTVPDVDAISGEPVLGPSYTDKKSKLASVEYEENVQRIFFVAVLGANVTVEFVMLVE